MLSIAILMLAHGPATNTAYPATVSAIVAPTVYADDGPYEQAKAEAGTAFAADLEELAKWCHKSKAYRERNQIYELLLTVQPDHKNARKTLGYTFDRKTEEWVRKREYREPKRSKPSVTTSPMPIRLGIPGRPWTCGPPALWTRLGLSWAAAWTQRVCDASRMTS